MPDLGRYPYEVKAIADELLELLEPIATAASNVLGKMGLKGLLEMDEKEHDGAMKLLSQTPSQRSKKLGRLDDETAAVLILRARYFGLVASNALKFADRFEMVPGRGYRDAAAFAATEAFRSQLSPSLRDLYPRFVRDVTPSRSDQQEQLWKLEDK